ncbi:MAG: LysR family transcriptional regulator substrate-binding protein, partial [Oceanobacter sp.]
TAVLPQRNTITYRLLEQAFNPLGLSINSPMPTNYLETIKMMVSVGLGWSLLPESMIDNSLHRLEWPAPEMNRQLGVIHLKHRTLSNGTQAFIKLLQSHKGLPERIRK